MGREESRITERELHFRKHIMNARVRKWSAKKSGGEAGRLIGRETSAKFR